MADVTFRESREPSHHVDAQKRLCALRLAGCAPRELVESAEEEARRDREEAVRLLYVAATRARDLLVVSAIGDDDPDRDRDDGKGERAGWLSGLDRAIFPDPAKRRSPISRKPAGCPEFGDDSVCERPPKAPLKQKSVAPGMHKGRTGQYCVVWWDPSKLDLDVRETIMGLRQSKLLEADENQERSTRGKEAWEQWRGRRAAAIVKGSVPTITAETVTTLAKATALLEADQITIEQTSHDPTRPHGQRFGTLVHLTMLRVPLDADSNKIQRVAAGEGRNLGASVAEIAAAARAVSAALATPLIKRAAQSRDLRRECPVILPLDGTAIEGIADLAFLEEQADGQVWTVVDFKTDAAIAPRLSEYRAQIALYVRGISEASGLPARGVVLWM